MRWMFAFALLIFLAFLAARPAGYGGPIQGSTAKGMEIPGAGFTTTERFRGGERARVQVVGKHDIATTVEITVYDPNGKKIAEDTGRGANSDMAAAFWYPPRDGDYKITIRNLESRPHTYFVFIR